MPECPIHPFGPRVVVQVNKVESTPGGLVLPDSVQSNMPFFTGTVVAVGKGRISPEGNYVALESKLGDTVLWRGNAVVDPFEKDGEKYLIIVEDYIYARIKL